MINRLKFDFNKSLKQITSELQIYIPDVTEEQINFWTQTNALENITIEDQTLYFHSAVRNLLRTEPNLRHLIYNTEGKERAGRQYILSKHIPEIIKQTVEQIKSIKSIFSNNNVTPIYGEFDPMGIYSNNPIPDFQDSILPNLAQKHNWKFFCRLTVEPNAVPDGQEIKCWLPMPRTDVPRQSATLEDQYNNQQTEHACYFQTKIAQKDKPTVFTNSFAFSSMAEYHPITENFNHQELEHTPELDKYLTEQAPHIIFAPNLVQMAKDIIGNETRPYFKARLIFEAMRHLYPWASAREYSTIENIPQYVIKQKHGDCGQISLLFITLCRISGIPARWQSGFMLHPGYENLHDWSEIFIPNIGWMPVDASFGVQHWAETEQERFFFFGGIDAFRLVVNSNWGAELTPKKLHPRSEPVDFQRGEVETINQNLYFNKFKFQFWIEPILNN